VRGAAIEAQDCFCTRAPPAAMPNALAQTCLSFWPEGPQRATVSTLELQELRSATESPSQVAMAAVPVPAQPPRMWESWRPNNRRAGGWNRALDPRFPRQHRPTQTDRYWGDGAGPLQICTGPLSTSYVGLGDPAKIVADQANDGLAPVPPSRPTPEEGHRTKQKKRVRRSPVDDFRVCPPRDILVCVIGRAGCWVLEAASASRAGVLLDL
jgi:hypothetical protein